MTQSTDTTVIRDAATIILLRQGPDGPAVLMGQRGATAAFMPDKFVFPGGAVDATDALVPVAMPEPCRTRMAQGHANPDALAAAAIREMWEETGLMMGLPGDWPDAPADWAGFAAHGLRPDAGGPALCLSRHHPAGPPPPF